MNQTIAIEPSTQMTLPLYQPLRFWTPKADTVQNTTQPERYKLSVLSAKGFSMKGGFVHSTSGVRRMIIAGKIFKNESREKV